MYKSLTFVSHTIRTVGSMDCYEAGMLTPGKVNVSHASIARLPSDLPTFSAKVSPLLLLLEGNGDSESAMEVTVVVFQVVVGCCMIIE